MESFEIERKYLIRSLPSDLESFKYKDFEQGYLSVRPVLRVRKEDDEYFVTYKGDGLLKREEYNMPLTKEAYYHLREKADGYVIKKRRYFIPIDEAHRIELDVFDGDLKPLILAEVEFTSEEDANSFVPPDWFGREVTYTGEYQNSAMSRNGLPKDFIGGEDE